MVQLMPLHPKTWSSLVTFKSRLVVPFWYRLSPVVLEKMPLNGCSSSSSGGGGSGSGSIVCLCLLYIILTKIAVVSNAASLHS